MGRAEVEVVAEPGTVKGAEEERAISGSTETGTKPEKSDSLRRPTNRDGRTRGVRGGYMRLHAVTSGDIPKAAAA